MNNSKIKSFKGFTLVELIVVIAVFGILMAAALSILSPVRNLFISTYKYSDSAAIADNFSKYIEDNIRYSNRLKIYDDVLVNNESEFVTKCVEDMVSDYYLSSKEKASQKVKDEQIYVFKIDNPNIDKSALSDATLSKTYLSSGRISTWQYDVNNGKWIAENGSQTGTCVKRSQSAINPEFYNDYIFTVTIEDSFRTSASDITNLHMLVNVFRDDNKRDTTKPLNNVTKKGSASNMISVPLVNLVTGKSIIKEDIYFYDDPDAAVKKIKNINAPISVFRYEYVNSYSSDPSTSNTTSGVDIYMVFTKAPHIELEK